MKIKTPKQLVFEADNGARKIVQSKLCWELTDRSRDMLHQEIYHLVMKMMLSAQDNIVAQSIPKKKTVIIDNVKHMPWGMGGPK